MLTDWDDSPSLSVGPLLWALLGGAATTAAYFLLMRAKSDPGAPQAPPAALPAARQSTADVRSQFERVRDLYRTGTTAPGQTLTELSALEDEAVRLQVVNKSDPAETVELLARMLSFRGEVEQDTRVV